MNKQIITHKWLIKYLNNYNNLKNKYQYLNQIKVIIIIIKLII